METEIPVLKEFLSDSKTLTLENKELTVYEDSTNKPLSFEVKNYIRPKQIVG